MGHSGLSCLLLGLESCKLLSCHAWGKLNLLLRRRRDTRGHSNLLLGWRDPRGKPLTLLRWLLLWWCHPRGKPLTLLWLLRRSHSWGKSLTLLWLCKLLLTWWWRGHTDLLLLLGRWGLVELLLLLGGRRLIELLLLLLGRRRWLVKLLLLLLGRRWLIELLLLLLLGRRWLIELLLLLGLSPILLKINTTNHNKHDPHNILYVWTHCHW